MMRDSIDPEKDEQIALPPDDQLIGDLTAPQYKYTSNGKDRGGKQRRHPGADRALDRYADAYALAKFAAHGTK